MYFSKGTDCSVVRTDLDVLFGHPEPLIGQTEVSLLLLGHLLLLLQSLHCCPPGLPQGSDLEPHN